MSQPNSTNQVMVV